MGAWVAAFASSPLLAETERVLPVFEEPMHRVVFRNDRIDVYSVRMNPGESSVYHRHRRDQLGIVLRSTRSLGQILMLAHR